MKYKNVKTVFIYTLLIILCFVHNSSSSSSNHSDHSYYAYRRHHSNHIRQTAVKSLHLNEGDVCRRSHGLGQDHVCVNEFKCEPGRITNLNHFDVCSSDGSKLIVCCPSSAINKRSRRATGDNDDTTNIAVEKCRRYGEMQFNKNEDTGELTKGEEYLSNVLKGLGGPRIAKPQEFPHMAMLGYGETAEEMDWRCSGSLVSERWILTAAHCHKMGSLARWARLGDVDRSPLQAGEHADYRIVQHVLHPQYKETERYNDIALFRLEKEIEFSASVRPICVNWDPLLDQVDFPIVNVWGKTYSGGELSNILIRVPLQNIPSSTCSNMYNALKKKDPKLKQGILSDRMLCAGSFNLDQEVCTGDSGGALQIENELYPGVFTQIGVTSFGSFCGVRKTPGGYTKVSKYVKWIEQIVWSDD